MSTPVQITITQALCELKTLDKRISGGIEALNPLFLKVGGKIKSRFPVEEATLVTNIKGDFNSVSDLIVNRDATKAAIVTSNAATKVTIAGKEMTIAAAIEHKKSINYKKALLGKLRMTLSTLEMQKDRHNQDMEVKLENLLVNMFGGKENRSTDAVTKTQADYRAANQAEFLDPINIVEKIKALEAEVLAFEAEVDVKLTISNSSTFITLG